MARILFCWELGAGSGHLTRLLPAALALRERGHEVLFALRDTSQAETVLGQSGLPYLQAPVWLLQVANPPPTLNYAAILVKAGWGDERGLTGLLRAWQQLYSLVSPDLILSDHGPTALLAARDLGIPRAALGTGYLIPPLANPFPPMNWWQPPPQEQLKALEGQVLQCTNRALDRLGVQHLGALTELFEVEERFLCCLPETDHYPRRESGARYWGHMPVPAGGAKPVWPLGNKGPWIFAYVYPEYADFVKVLDALKALRLPTLVYAPGLPETAARIHGSATLAFSPLPLAMEEVVAKAGLIITHSAAGTGMAGLLAGVPVLLLPLHIENMMAAQRVSGLGVGLWTSPSEGPVHYGERISRLLDDGVFKKRVAGFAAGQAQLSPEEHVGRIAARCEELLAQGK